MKRMLAAGGQANLPSGPRVRLDEIGPLHNPEFTLVEWYQPGEGLDEVGDLLQGDAFRRILSKSH